MAEQIRLEEGFRPSYRPDRRGAGFDPDMRRMGLVAAGLGAGVALLVGAATLLRPAHHGTPVVAAETGPVRVKPLDPGGMKFSGADIGAVSGQGPQLAPAAEQPEIAALKAQLQQVKKQLAKQAAATVQATKLAQVAAAQPKVAAPVPVERASATARIVVPPPIAPIPAAGTQVQLAAFSDAATARAAWASLAKQAPDLLRGHTPDVTRVDAAGRTMWRLRTGNFGTVTEAAKFCAKVRDRGGSCSIAAF